MNFLIKQGKGACFAAIFIVLFMNVGESRGENSPVPDSPLGKEQIDQLLNTADKLFRNQKYTGPKEANAYDFYRKVLESDPDNEYALKKTHDILEMLLNMFSEKIKAYGKLVNEETEGKDVKVEMVLSLTEMIAVLQDCKRICEEYPRKDKATEQMCGTFKESIAKYEKLRSYYQSKIK